MNTPRTWIEISQSALRHNIKTIKTIIHPQQQLGVVIKSNAYGHGLVTIARLLDQEPDVDWLFTVSLSEAIEVRQAGVTKSLLVMGVLDEDPALALKYSIDLAITNEYTAHQLEAIAKKYHQPFSVHIKIDTGLSRLGIQMDSALSSIKRISQSPYLTVKGIFTHLADNKNEHASYTHYQIEQFTTLVNQARQFLGSFSTHAYASASLLSEHHTSTFDMVRVGTGIYGLCKSTKQEELFKQHGLSLQPVLQWKSYIIEIKQLPAGTSVGYGCTHTTTQPITIGIVPIGYWDGYPLCPSGKAVALVNDKPAPVLGVTTMNMITLDITALKNVHIGSHVTLIGSHPEVNASVLAARSASVNIALLSRLNPQIPRVVIEHEDYRPLSEEARAHLQSNL